LCIQKSLASKRREDEGIDRVGKKFFPPNEKARKKTQERKRQTGNWVKVENPNSRREKKWTAEKRRLLVEQGLN